MNVVIDEECFKDNKNRIIPKQVAVCALDKEFTAHWIIALYARLNRLGQNIRKQNNWLMQQHHGTDWCKGDISEKLLYNNLQKICNKAEKV